MVNLKTMLIGGPVGLGIDFIERFNADTFSRRNNYNIDTQDARKQIAEKSIEYDLVIVHAYTLNNGQLLVLQEIVKKWIDENHLGHIIVTGSTATHFVTYKPEPKHWLYTAHKSSIDTFCKMISKKSIEGRYNFKISVIKPGMLDTEKSRSKDYFIKGISGSVYCDTIEFLLQLPNGIQIPEIILETTYKE